MKMKNLTRLFVIVFALICGFRQANAQVVSSLHTFALQDFNASGTFTNADGSVPRGVLILTNDLLYGTTVSGGTNGSGTIFVVNTNCTGFTVLHTFAATTNDPLDDDTNADGGHVVANLAVLGNTVYGAAQEGGTNAAGTVFSVKTNATGFLVLHTFTAYDNENSLGDGTNTDGAAPSTGVVLSGVTVYGVTSEGGTNGSGTIFSVKTNGATFTVVHTFGRMDQNDATGNTTNSDGFGTSGITDSSGVLLLHSNILFGTEPVGGTNGFGTLYSVKTNGTLFAVLHTFGLANFDASITFTNSDGINPQGGLIVFSNTLYGTACQGGTNGSGTVFSLNTNGTGFKLLHTFSAITQDDFGNFTNSDGCKPAGSLYYSSNTIYGTTTGGGLNGFGTVFSIDTNGTGFTTLYSFNPLILNETTSSFTNSEGADPVAGFVRVGKTFYGATQFGGTNGSGTLYALNLGLLPSIPLAVQPSGSNVQVTWGNSAFALQAAPAVTGPWATVNGATNPFTAPPTNTMRFFRLVGTNSP